MNSPLYLPQFDVIIATDMEYAALHAINSASRLANRKFYAAGCHGFYGYIFADLVIHDYVLEGDIPNVPISPGQETLTRSIQSVTRVNGRQRLAKREIYSPIMLANTSDLPENIRNSRAKLKKVPTLLSMQRGLWEFEQQKGRPPMTSGTTGEHLADLREFTVLAMEAHKLLCLPIDSLKAESLRTFLTNIYSQLPPTTAMIGGILAQDVINVIGQREQPIQNLTLFDAETYTTATYALHPGNVSDGTTLANGTAPAMAAAAVAQGEVIEL